MEENLTNLVETFVNNNQEKEWLEFKRDNDNAEMIGKDICALANGAALLERPHAYMIWGIDDQSHQILGTKFSPYEKCRGNQELISWLHEMLSNNFDFDFNEVIIDDKKVIVLTISSASLYPAAFKKESYVRIGSYTKRLADDQKVQQRLWKTFRNERFELSAALHDLTADEVEEKLDVKSYFLRLKINEPYNQSDRIEYLITDSIIKQQDNQLFSVTNFGAILLAKKFEDFPSILRKEIRVVQYEGTSRTNISRSKSFAQGYACCLPELLNYIDALLPSSEPIPGLGEREIHRTYPPAAVRELLINAIIHQDLTSIGNSVLFEIFSNRIEITNPGTLLVSKNRILDLPPQSRNILLARAMRRMHFCEEMGTGWDRVTEACEKAQLPSPDIIEYDISTKVVIYSHIDFFELSQEQKVWSCYLHACIMYINGKGASNSSLRKRFGLDKSSSSSISRLITRCISAGLLKLKDTSAGTKSKKYIPFWG